MEGELGLLESGSGPLQFHIPFFLGCDKLQLNPRQDHFPRNKLDSHQTNEEEELSITPDDLVLEAQRDGHLDKVLDEF